MYCLSSFRDRFFFFFNDTATTEIYTLSLHDALPICEALDLALVGERPDDEVDGRRDHRAVGGALERREQRAVRRSEEHTSELQSPDHLVCRLLLEKKKNIHATTMSYKIVLTLHDILC